MKRGLDEFILVINRKSRIIMKDAVTILKKPKRLRKKLLPGWWTTTAILKSVPVGAALKVW